MKTKLILALFIGLVIISNCKKNNVVLTPPTVKLINVTQIDSITTNCEISVESDGGAEVTERGICVSSININPEIGNVSTNKIILGAGKGSVNYNYKITNTSSKYYFRAYAINSEGVSYSSTIEFSLGSLPTINTSEIKNLFTPSGTALSGGNITDDGGKPILTKGVCWSNTNKFPTIDESKTNEGAGKGVFSSTITNLKAAQIYYVRAYATNMSGISYGSVININTPQILIATKEPIINGIIVTIPALITSDGGYPITERGVCWSKSNNQPTVNDSKTNDGSGIGDFISTPTNILEHTKYYARAYAKNSEQGYVYGNVIEFTITISLGDSYQGGIIAYILQAGDFGYDPNITHGLIAASNDLPLVNDYYIFGCDGTTVGTNDNIGYGKSNTMAIINKCQSSQTNTKKLAAKSCTNLVLNGYNDWYLPSIEELGKLYLNRYLIGGLNGNLYTAQYLSSSEGSSGGCCIYDFVNAPYKNCYICKECARSVYDFNVRPIRSF